MQQQDLLDILFLNRKQLSATPSPSLPQPSSAASSPASSRSAPTSNSNSTSTEASTTHGLMAGEGNHESSAGAGDADKCPVDHKSREAWLLQARAAREAGLAAPSTPSPPSPHPMRASASTMTSTMTSTMSSTAAAPTAASSSSSLSWNPLSWRIPYFSSASASASVPASSSQTTPKQPPLNSSQARPRGPDLPTDREVSTIPRSSVPGSSRPSNHETETGADAATGNWVYPSEKMFFEALKRKGNSGGARVADMRTIVPIHNAVNERAWKQIKEWEAPYVGEGKCGGPKLESFTGLSTRMSPKARINTLLGYQSPFDRHDWVIDRCGTKVEYVIDFYQGRTSASASPGQPQINFYLDVRPKLNSWEGVKMRALRAIGAV